MGQFYTHRVPTLSFGNQAPHLMLLMKRIRTKALIINLNVTYLTPKPLNAFIILEANYHHGV